MSRRPKSISAALNNRNKQKAVTRSNSIASTTSSNRSELEIAYEKLVEKYKLVELEVHNLKCEVKPLREENQRLRLENERLTHDNVYLMKTRDHKEYEISELHDKLEETNSMKRGSKFASMVGKLQLKLKRRPTIETLARNGYYKNEPCFGNDLNSTIMHDVHFDVPKVLVESIKVLEGNPLYMKSLGLYRISGSHTVIQKLRFKINSNNYKLLCEQTDPNNITGLIKLFFRELRKPLISLDQIRDTIPKEEYGPFADPNTDEHYRVVRMRMLIEKLAPKYRSTLKFFVEHLKRFPICIKN
ncbi:hypothetical protein HA402_007530 [Bradysia odoriphaga]|nr:hypothetical protein HA402_007530 [Bradysia odoriphaga]